MSFRRAAFAHGVAGPTRCGWANAARRKDMSLPRASRSGTHPAAGRLRLYFAGRSRAMDGGPGIKIGRILGIPIYLHASWFIIFALITFSLAKQFAYQHSHWTDAQHWAAGLITSLLFFGSVLFHELAHSVVALL